MFQPELSANLKFFQIQHCGTVFTIPLPPAFNNSMVIRWRVKLEVTDIYHLKNKKSIQLWLKS